MTRTCLGALFVLGGLAGCGEGGGGTADAGPADAGGGIDAGPATSALVGAAAGGMLTSADGIFTLVVPPGSIAADTTFTIAVVPRSEWTAEQRAMEVYGEIYRVEPSGTTFDPPASAHWVYTDEDATRPILDAWTASGAGPAEPLQCSVLVDGGIVRELASPVAHLTDLWSTPIATVGGLHLGDLPEQILPLGDTWTASPISLVVDDLVSGGAGSRGLTLDRGGMFAESYPFSVVLTIAPEAWPGGESSLSWLTGGASSHWLRVSPAVDSPRGMTFTFPEEPRWMCVGEGSGRYRYGALLAMNGSVNLFHGFSGNVTCYILDAAILLADVCRASRSGTTLTCAAARSTNANVIHPRAVTGDRFAPVEGGSSTIYEGVTAWESELGASPIALVTSRQVGTAVHDGTRYAISGLTAGGVFADTDTLTVRGTPPGASAAVTVTVGAPPPLSTPADVLGPLSGLSTEMHFADGAFDAMYVYASITGSTMTGDAGVIRVVSASSMTLAGGVRSAPLFDTATLDALAARGLAVGTVTVGPIREVLDESLFPGLSPIPVQAGRFVQVAASDL